MKKLNFLQEKDKKYSKYSLGTKQKLGIAQVLMEDPKIMIFDEPFNGVENDTAASIRALLKEEAKKDRQKVTVFGLTKLGLMEMTRERRGLPLSKQNL